MASDPAGNTLVLATRPGDEGCPSCIMVCWWIYRLLVVVGLVEAAFRVRYLLDGYY